MVYWYELLLWGLIIVISHKKIIHILNVYFKEFIKLLVNFIVDQSIYALLFLCINPHLRTFLPLILWESGREWGREGEEGGDQEGEGEKKETENINVKETHGLASSCMGPRQGQELNLKPFHPPANTLTTEHISQGFMHFFRESIWPDNPVLSPVEKKKKAIFYSVQKQLK